MINVICQVHSYEDSVKYSIKVHNHWNNNKIVILEFEGQKIAVNASELKAAIDNCTNTEKF